MKTDILILAAHPDDAELSCGATILAQIAAGKTVGIVDFTRGEMGTRGTAAIRDREAADAAEVLGLAFRENLDFQDVHFVNDKAHQLEIIKMIRKYRPEIVLANAISDRHPDHGKAAQLAVDAIFMSGLQKIATTIGGEPQEAHRPRAVYHFIQSNFIQPDFVVDVSDFWEGKVRAIRAFRSQFHDPESQEPQTFISSPEFLQFIEARAKEMGHSIGVKYGEGFTKIRNIGVKNLFDLI